MRVRGIAYGYYKLAKRMLKLAAADIANGYDVIDAEEFLCGELAAALRDYIEDFEKHKLDKYR